MECKRHRGFGFKYDTDDESVIPMSNTVASREDHIVNVLVDPMNSTNDDERPPRTAVGVDDKVRGLNTRFT